MLYQCGLFLKQAGLFEQLWTLLKMYLELNLSPMDKERFSVEIYFNEKELVELEEVSNRFVLKKLLLPYIYCIGRWFSILNCHITNYGWGQKNSENRAIGYHMLVSKTCKRIFDVSVFLFKMIKTVKILNEWYLTKMLLNLFIPLLLQKIFLNL